MADLHINFFTRAPSFIYIFYILMEFSEKNWPINRLVPLLGVTTPPGGKS